jgi:signal peptidase II
LRPLRRRGDGVSGPAPTGPATPPSVRLLAIAPLAIVAVDQVTKLWVTGRMDLFESWAVLPGFFSITYVRNPGAAFGLFADMGDLTRMAILVGVSLVAVGLLTAFFLRSPHADRVSRVAAVLVMGGAVGNLIDRIRFGEVIDFLDLYLGRYHWPAFNVADSCITVGIGLFIVGAWRERGARLRTRPAARTGFRPEDLE